MKKYILISICILFFSSCTIKPQAITTGEDVCEWCKMNISDLKFSWEIITDKGKYYVFDDVYCMQHYLAENPLVKNDAKQFWVTDYSHPDILINATSANYFYSPDLKSPMNGNIIAFENKEKMNEEIQNLKGEEKTWSDIFK